MVSISEATTPDDVRGLAATTFRDYLLEHEGTSSPALDGVRSVAGDRLSDDDAIGLANRVHTSELVDPTQSMGFHGAMIATVELEELPPETVEALRAEYPYLASDEGTNG